MVCSTPIFLCIAFNKGGCFLLHLCYRHRKNYNFCENNTWDKCLYAVSHSDCMEFSHYDFLSLVFLLYPVASEAMRWLSLEGDDFCAASIWFAD